MTCPCFPSQHENDLLMLRLSERHLQLGLLSIPKNYQRDRVVGLVGKQSVDIGMSFIQRDVAHLGNNVILPETSPVGRAAGLPTASHRRPTLRAGYSGRRYLG